MYTITLGMVKLPNSEWLKDTLPDALYFAEKLWGWKKVTFVRIVDSKGNVVREIFR